MTEPYSYAPMVMDYDNQEELSFKLNSNESPYIYDSTSSFSFPENSPLDFYNYSTLPSSSSSTAAFDRFDSVESLFALDEYY